LDEIPHHSTRERSEPEGVRAVGSIDARYRAAVIGLRAAIATADKTRPANRWRGTGFGDQLMLSPERIGGPMLDTEMSTASTNGSNSNSLRTSWRMSLLRSIVRG
jgi:hypothetical protein